jgi:antitoxin VapB
MAMNIKSQEAERLSRELARLTGESLTAAVTLAVSERLARVQRARLDDGADDRADRILALGRQIAPLLSEPWASQPHGELLYDDRGLPATLRS